jgi:oligopeptidase B
MRRAYLQFCAIILALSGCSVIQPELPVAKKIPTKLEKHGHIRIDDYYWLKERDNPEVINYLKAENDYTQTIMAHTKGLQETLFQEFKTRIKQTDMSVPYKKDDYYYYTRTEEGKEYPFYCRKKGSLAKSEHVMLDVNKMAKGHEFFSVSQRNISQNQDILAYSIDTMGRRIYKIRFKDLVTDKPIRDEIENVTGNMAWANDNRTLFYTRQDPVTLRSYQVYKHVLGTDSSNDDLVFEETDETFSCYVFKTKSKKYIMIVSYHTLSTEYRYLEADNPNGEFQVFLPRKRDHEYSVDHYRDHFYIRTNHEAKNFKLAKTTVDRTGLEYWKDVVPHRDDVLFEDMEIFKDHLVIVERKNGLKQIRIRPWSEQEEYFLNFKEPAYYASPMDNYDFNISLLRFSYTSLTTPQSVYDYDMVTKKKMLLKQEEVLGGFSSDNYQSERIFAEAEDGSKIPVSLLWIQHGCKIQSLCNQPDGPWLYLCYSSYPWWRRNGPLLV